MSAQFVTEVHVNGSYFKGAIQYVAAVEANPTATPPVVGVPAHYKFFLNAQKAVAFDLAGIEALQDELLEIANKVTELNNALPV